MGMLLDLESMWPVRSMASDCASACRSSAPWTPRPATSSMEAGTPQGGASAASAGSSSVLPALRRLEQAHLQCCGLQLPEALGRGAEQTGHTGELEHRRCRCVGQARLRVWAPACPGTWPTLRRSRTRSAVTVSRWRSKTSWSEAPTLWCLSLAIAPERLGESVTLCADFVCEGGVCRPHVVPRRACKSDMEAVAELCT